MRLCHSRMYLVQIFPRESQEMVFEAHERAFRLFVGKKRDYNRRFQEMCSHHLVEPVARPRAPTRAHARGSARCSCTPGAGWEKGQVEKQVGARPAAFSPAA